MSGYIRIAAAVPRLETANINFNVQQIISLYRKAAEKKAAVVLFPELSVTGSSCGDLFFDKLLLRQSRCALQQLAAATSGCNTILAVGLPWQEKSRVLNVIAVCQNGEVRGFTAKGVIPGFAQRMENRTFSPGEEMAVELGNNIIACDVNMVYETQDFAFGIEFGSDLSSVCSPGAAVALAGAQIILCPAAEPELAGAAALRRTLLCAASVKYSSVCVYCGAGTGESTGENLFSGHALIASEGEIIAENRRFERGESLIFADVNMEHNEVLRRKNATFNAHPGQMVSFAGLEQVPFPEELTYLHLNPMPFIPEDPVRRNEYCQEIFDIQTGALARRFTASRSKRMVIGLSGGLDSTMALLVCLKCCDLLELPRNTICAVTMPGFGTSDRTKNNAGDLALLTGAELRTISINDAVRQHFADIGHDPENRNVVYENSQARERTQILMDIANEENGIVIGTGDLSEIALGWSTFNGDHMSMYCVNCDIPKTLMRTMVEFAASSSDAPLAAALRDICDTPVSPELLPGAQHTESIIGSYELHDFYLYYFIRYAETPENLLKLAAAAFREQYPQEELKRTLDIFIRRFFTQQFKRNAAPDGPAVSDVSLSAKSHWRMPADAAFDLWK